MRTNQQVLDAVWARVVRADRSARVALVSAAVPPTRHNKTTLQYLKENQDHTPSSQKNIMLTRTQTNIALASLPTPPRDNAQPPKQPALHAHYTLPRTHCSTRHPHAPLVDGVDEVDAHHPGRLAVARLVAAAARVPDAARPRPARPAALVLPAAATRNNNPYISTCTYR